MRRTGRGEGVLSVIAIVSYPFAFPTRTETDATDWLPYRSYLLFISLSSIFERERNDAIPFFPFALFPPAGSLLLADIKCSPVRRAWDVRAAAMMA